jgi:phage terminase small subunit
MPVLPNQRHEKFAQDLAQGKTATEAYVLAGYRANRHNAARLKSIEHIGARVLEIQGVAARSAEISVASLLDELEHARQRADSLGQLSASVRAISEKARLAGLVVDRQQIEVTNVDPYADATDPQEVLAKVAEESEEVAILLGRAFRIEYDPDWRKDLDQKQSQRAIEDWRPPKTDRKREIG